MFNAIVLRKTETQTVSLEQLEDNFISDNEVFIDIEYSNLNYKDCLAITNKSPIARSYPLIPGIDFAGIVKGSSVKEFKVGDKVVLNGFGVGEKISGGLSQKASAKAEWLLKLPDNLSTFEAMAIGTAGYTAMLAVMEIEAKNYDKNDAEIIVTGVGGGVGGIAVSLLASLGYKVIGATSRIENSDYIKSLGAHKVITYTSLLENTKPLLKENWLAGIDVLGGSVLDRICSATKYGGTVVVCGLADNIKLNTTVFPFILRGISIIGIDSVYCPMQRRMDAWEKLSQLINRDHLKTITSTISLKEVIDTAKLIIDRKIKGRIVIDTSST